MQNSNFQVNTPALDMYHLECSIILNRTLQPVVAFVVWSNNFTESEPVPKHIPKCMERYVILLLVAMEKNGFENIFF